MQRLLLANFLISVLVFGCGSSAERDQRDQIVERTDVQVHELRPGDCFNDYADPLAAALEVAAVAALPCDEPHQYEVYFVFSFADDAAEWPGEDAVIAQAQARCLQEFQTYVATPQASDFSISFVYPSPDGWRAFERGVVCYLGHSHQEPLVGSMGGAGTGSGAP